MPYAAYNYTISDASGNIVTGSSIEVRRESDNVLVPLYSDRAGAVSIANPFTDATGTGRFHAAGSAYKVTATLGGFTRTFRYVPIGLAGETDNAVIAVAAGTGISVDATDPTTPSVALTSAVQTSLGKADTALQAASIGVTVQGYDADTAKLDVEEQVVTGGARVTSKSLGTITTGTLTLDPGDRPLQHYTNNGAHTLAPGSNGGTIILEILNGASAGAVTTSGFTKVSGSFTTTNTHKFHCSVVVGNAFSSLTILALQ
jgi:hypothetical protein